MYNSEYHHKAAPILQELLQIEVKGYDTLCSFAIKGMVCEVVFKDKEAFVTLFVNGAPRTPQTYKRLVVDIDKNDVSQSCVKVVDAVNKITGVIKIAVKKHDNCWKAFLKDKVTIYETNDDVLRALGSLFFKNPEQFGVEIEIEY